MSTNPISHPTTQSVQDLLELIEGINHDISDMEKLQNENTRSLLIRQLEHLKKEFTGQLFQLLERYRLPVLVEMAV